MGASAEMIRKLEEVDPKIRDVLLYFMDEVEEKSRLISVGRGDFNELRNVVQRLAESQERTEESIKELFQAQKELSQSQDRTEQSVKELTQSQDRTEQSVKELTQSQDRTAQSVKELTQSQDRTAQSVKELTQSQDRTAQSVKELTQSQDRTAQSVKELSQAQKDLTQSQGRTEQRVDALAESQKQGFQALTDQIAALGSRWGIYNEGTFRGTIRGLMSKMKDVEVREGYYGDRQVDVIIRNGEHVMLEITSRMHPKDIAKIYSSADDYKKKEGIVPSLMVATSYISPRLMEKIMGLERKIEIFSYESEE